MYFVVIQLPKFGTTESIPCQAINLIRPYLQPFQLTLFCELFSGKKFPQKFRHPPPHFPTFASKMPRLPNFWPLLGGTPPKPHFSSKMSLFDLIWLKIAPFGPPKGGYPPLLDPILRSFDCNYLKKHPKIMLPDPKNMPKPHVFTGFGHFLTMDPPHLAEG
jgi:hypothetical protein